jgi:phage gp36-like protein
MSQYAAESDLISLQIPAAALAGITTAGIDPDDHLTKASGKVDSYLRGRYRLPLAAPYPDEIVTAACAIGAYTIMCARGFDPENGTHVNIRMQHDDALAWLKEVAAGRVNLDLQSDATGGSHDGGPIVRSQSRQVVGRRDWSDCE